LHASVYLESRARGMYLQSIVGKMVEKTICEFANAVTVPTPEYRDYLHKTSQGKTKKIYVVPSCVDVNRFTLRSSKKIQSELGVPLDNYLVFYHGSPYPENFKALKILVHVVNELNKRGLETKALVAGDFQNNVVANSQDIIFTGWLTQEELARYMSSADIAILPLYLKSKGISTRILEYMASGKATITTKYGATGIEFAVREGGLVIVNTPKEMVETADYLLRNESFRESVGKTARMIIEKYLSPKSVGERLDSIYSEILNFA